MKFASELELCFIGIISLPLKGVSSIVINIIQIEKTIETSYFNIVLNIEINHIVTLQTLINKELEVALENKVYLETYYHHKPSQI
jgi:predicted amino acid-binding ACT domain protein